MQSPDGDRVLRPRGLGPGLWSRAGLAASTERDRMQQAVMNNHRTEVPVEERQGWSFTQHLMAETAALTQPSATPREVRRVELADTMGAEGTSVEVELALRAAVSPEPWRPPSQCTPSGVGRVPLWSLQKAQRSGPGEMSGCAAGQRYA